MSLEFRLANQNDATTLADILNDAKRIKQANSDTAWDGRNFTPDEISDLLADPHGQMFVGYTGDRPVSTVLLSDRDKRIWSDTDGTENSLYVHKLARTEGSYGAGTETMAFAERLARKLGKTSVRLDNPEGLDDYYEGLGYLPVGAKDLGPYQPVLREKKI